MEPSVLAHIMPFLRRYETGQNVENFPQPLSRTHSAAATMAAGRSSPSVRRRAPASATMRAPSATDERMARLASAAEDLVLGARLGAASGSRTHWVRFDDGTTEELVLSKNPGADNAKGHKFYVIAD